MPAEFVPTPATIAEAMHVIGPVGVLVVILGLMLLYYGIRRAPAHAPGPDKAASAGIQAAIADHLMVDRLVNNVGELADSQRDLAKAINRACDMMDLTAALQKLQGRQTSPPP